MVQCVGDTLLDIILSNRSSAFRGVFALLHLVDLHLQDLIINLYSLSPGTLVGRSKAQELDES